MSEYPFDAGPPGAREGSAPGPAVRPAAEQGPLRLELDRFEGPLDLLLHLVRSQEMDILDLPIVEIARQYNAYLERMRRMNLEIAAEYLVMAATLAHIKSRLLLPPEPAEDGEEAEDPRAELSRQLLEYERYRRAVEELAALESGRDLVFTRPGPPPRELAGEVTIRADLDDLVRAFERVLRRLEGEERVETIRRDDYPVRGMMERLLARLRPGRPLSFRALLGECRTRLERIVLFLALLELMRLGAVTAWQPALRSDIRLEPTGKVPALDTSFDGNAGVESAPPGMGAGGPAGEAARADARRPGDGVEA